jgi:hypothetical protein
MEKPEPSKAYRAAYDTASSELRKIFAEAERLLDRHDRVANLVDVLNRRFGFEAHVAADHIAEKTEQPGFSVVTRITVVQTEAGPEN